MEGVHASDKVSVGSLSIPKTGILVATSENGEVFEQSPFDGVLGFSRHDDVTKDPQGKEVHFNFLASAKAEGRIKKNIISFYLGFKSGAGGGAAILGGVDPRLFHGDLSYHPVLKGSNGNWAIKISKMYLKGSDKNFCPEAGCLGVVDTGTSLIVAAPPVANPLLKALEAQEDCSNLNKLPEILMELDGGSASKPYSLSSNDYMIELVDGDQKMCQPAVKAAGARIPMAFPGQADMPLVILGDVFLRRYYAAFDNDDPAKPQIGLAASNDQVQVKDPRA